MKVTTEFLIRHKACRDMMDKFVKIFGDGAEFNKENIEKYIKEEKYAYMGFYWLGQNVLNEVNYFRFGRFYILCQYKGDTDKFALDVGLKLKELWENQ